MVNILTAVYESAVVTGRPAQRVRRVRGVASRLFGALRRVGPAMAVAAALPAAPLAAQVHDRAVTSVRFRGNRVLDAITLGMSISTSPSDCFLNIAQLRHVGLCQPRPFDELEFRRDVVRLSLLYRQRGYYDARVDTVVARGERTASVTFRIVEGLPVRVESVAVRGTDAVVPEAAILRRLSFRPGQPFDRLAFEGAADTIGLLLKDRGHPFVQVYRGFDVDRTARRARVSFDVVPGPRARVGEIRLVGPQAVAAGTVRHAIGVREGDWFSQRALLDAQRDLYDTELFAFADVAVARDSTVGGVDSLVRLQVQVSEGVRDRLRLGAGYGTIDCFRAQGTWAAGGFLGGTRRLEAAAKVSKLGAGSPTDLGLRRTLCPVLADDPFSQRVNYITSLGFTQPQFLARHNELSVSAFAERRSEFKAYERQAVGGVVALTFGAGLRLPVTVAYRLSYGRTAADPATFCTFFDRCEESTVALLSERRREAALVVTAVRNTASPALQPSSGGTYLLEATHASPLIGSDSLIVFNKVVGEATWYRRVPALRRWVLAVRLRGGVIRPGLALVADSAIRFVPPEERFYAGGPSSVRGFDRNTLGPVVYVADSLRIDATSGDTVPDGLRTSPVGSYAILLANVELRIPAPLFSERMRLAAFVDLGRLWDMGEQGMVSAGYRVTPGIGVRILTPLGPIRVDVAYNDYPRQRGPLYVAVAPTATTPGRLDVVSADYPGPERGTSFLDRLRFQFSVGEAY